MSSFKESKYKLWGGCFKEGPSDVMRRLNDSLPVDCRLYQEDVQQSREWARALHDAELLSRDDFDSIRRGLEEVSADIQKTLAQHKRLDDPEEDIHSVVERRLTEYAGDAALRLHTGRSRNDQSATDTRLWMLHALPRFTFLLTELIETLLRRAERELDIIIPGYTHLQRAQPVRWSHFLLSQGNTIIYLAIDTESKNNSSVNWVFQQENTYSTKSLMREEVPHGSHLFPPSVIRVHKRRTASNIRRPSLAICKRYREVSSLEDRGYSENQQLPISSITTTRVDSMSSRTLPISHVKCGLSVPIPLKTPHSKITLDRNLRFRYHISALGKGQFFSERTSTIRWVGELNHIQNVH
ncbi:Argininosuccinate lyase [Eumeta japonica]|uniref:Argininosuccinate lyase n=1 Tax=Eumeta variegata TaxID=151549 RepID=A0A4C1TBB7_EUMVA|nr:Argininosuccinate lyase [Eumeta japonica]